MISLYSDLIKLLDDIKEYKKLSNRLYNFVSKYPNGYFGNDNYNEYLRFLKTRMSHIGGCASNVSLAVSEDDHTQARLSNGYFCRMRICPQCQKRRSLRLYSQIMTMFEGITDQYKFIHLTLTVPNVSIETIDISISKIFESSRKLFNAPRIKESWLGVIRSLEVTYNSNTDTLHPHLHCLIVVNKSYFTSRDYLKFEYVQNLWNKLNNYNNGNLMLHIRKVDNLENAVNEVVKYAAKPFGIDNTMGDMDSELKFYCFLSRALHNRRLVQTFGLCSELSKKYRIELDKDIEIDYIKGEVKHHYEHNRGDYYPIQRTESERTMKLFNYKKTFNKFLEREEQSLYNKMR